MEKRKEIKLRNFITAESAGGNVRNMHFPIVSIVLTESAFVQFYLTRVNDSAETVRHSLLNGHCC